MMQDISINKPGQKIKLPQQLLQQISCLSHRYKKTVPFFGGHPISMTKKDENNIFSQLNSYRQSPYLLCQKTDGVRYILIVTNEGCYFVSRQGSKLLVAYEALCQITTQWNINYSSKSFRQIIHILDGEMIKDVIGEKQSYKYLIFDALVIFNDKIIDLPLKQRLLLIERFNQSNKMLLEVDQKARKQPIEVVVKDFFRLTCNNYVSSQIIRRERLTCQPTTIQFLFRYYIKCLPHENDGVIFNHQEKPYLLGPNNGYLKWKPAHLNTVDFLIIPNTKLIPRFGRRVLDLYLGSQDMQLTGQQFTQNIYRTSFYNFTVVDEHQFDKIQNQINEKIQSNMNEGDQGTLQFGLIAECKYETVSNQQKKIFKQLLSSNKEPDQIYIDTMRKHNQESQLQIIKKLQNTPYMNYWKIFRIRLDKNTPNYKTIVTKIEQSIKDNIKVETLIVKNKQLLDKMRI